ncbi:MAG TPA: phosphoribosylanthranilate isomerase [Ruminiclostridium sp.]|nr:phosphoribosylanthranilate isomerase [Ruminiclostridium sp.]
MSDTKIKICGLSRIQDIEYVNDALPDFIGFVFAQSRRQVKPEAAGELKAALDNRIKAVGVFVNEDTAFIKDLCHHGIIDYIQLHGDESNEYIANLKLQLERANCSKPIIKAVRVKDSETMGAAGQYNTDFLLLDTYIDREYGGTGKAFDWKLASSTVKPFFLAGGLNYNNVLQAINTAKPFSVDISSGVETDGNKDRTKIKNIVKLIRSVE